MHVALGEGRVPADSCCEKFTNRLKSEKTIQVAKSAFWFLGSIASLLIPVTYLNGFVAGGTLFMCAHSMIQHPDSVCMQGSLRGIAQTRTWKHLLSGAAVSASLWGAGTVGMMSRQHPIVIGLSVSAAIIGYGGGIRLAYSNVLFGPRARETHVALSDVEEV